MIVECPACNTIFPVDPKKVPTGGIDARCSVCSEVFFVAPPEPEVEVIETDVKGIETEVEVPEPFVEEALPEAVVEPDFDEGIAPGDILEATLESEPLSERAEPTFEPLDESSVEEAEGSLEEGDIGEEVLSGAPDAETAELVDEVAEGVEEAAEAVDEVEAVVEDATEAVEEVVETAVEATEIVEEVAEGPTISAPVFGKRDPNEKAQRLARVLVSDIILYNPDRHHSATETGRVKEEFEEEIQKSWSEYLEQVGEEVANTTPYFNDALNEILAKGEKIF